MSCKNCLRVPILWHGRLRRDARGETPTTGARRRGSSKESNCGRRNCGCLGKVMNKHGYTGVRKRAGHAWRRKPYYARTYHRGSYVSSRYFATAEEAAAEYVAMRENPAAYVPQVTLKCPYAEMMKGTALEALCTDECCTSIVTVPQL